jgi:hypothetical protein
MLVEGYAVGGQESDHNQPVERRNDACFPSNMCSCPCSHKDTSTS